MLKSVNCDLINNIIKILNKKYTELSHSYHVISRYFYQAFPVDFKNLEINLAACNQPCMYRKKERGKFCKLTEKKCPNLNCSLIKLLHRGEPPNLEQNRSFHN